MFICNFRFNKNKFVRVFSISLVFFSVLIVVLSVLKIINSAKINVNSNTIEEISADNFTSFLKDSHENIDSYVGRKFCLSGYVYRMPDFSSDQFVIARTMIINSNNNSNAVIVGILASVQNASEFKDSEWISCIGTISKCSYNGEMPVIIVEKISRIEVPDDDFVYPPSI